METKVKPGAGGSCGFVEAISLGQAGKGKLPPASHCWLIKVQSESKGGTQPASSAQEAKCRENELCL